jgi:hypothetical protein
MITRSLLRLREHCAKLSQFLANPDVYSRLLELVGELIDPEGECITWSHAAEWLYIAASIEKVEVNTIYFDSSVYMCEPALDYEGARSDLLTEFTTALSVFNFAWGSLESVIKLIEPPSIPKEVKAGRGSSVDRAIYYLKTDFEPERPIFSYHDTMGEMRELLSQLPGYLSLSDEFRLQPHVGISGVGLHVVRKIRNMFAHGSIQMPVPADDRKAPLPGKRLIETSTRIVLLTIQMLLMSRLRKDDFKVECYEDEIFDYIDMSAYHVLRLLHTQIEEGIGGEVKLL